MKITGSPEPCSSNSSSASPTAMRSIVAPMTYLLAPAGWPASRGFTVNATRLVQPCQHPSGATSEEGRRQRQRERPFEAFWRALELPLRSTRFRGRQSMLLASTAAARRRFVGRDTVLAAAPSGQRDDGLAADACPDLRRTPTRDAQSRSPCRAAAERLHARLHRTAWASEWHLNAVAVGFRGRSGDWDCRPFGVGSPVTSVCRL